MAQVWTQSGFQDFNAQEINEQALESNTNDKWLFKSCYKLK